MQCDVIRDLVLPAVKKHGSRTAVIADGRTWTYRELHNAAREVASILVARGVKASDPVAIMLDNSAEYLVADLAIASVGAAKVPINLMLSPAEMTYILSDSGAKLVLTSDARRGTLSDATGESVLEKLILSVSDERRVAVADADGPLTADAAQELPAVSAEDIALIMYTGGTTGRPKGVVHLQKGFASNLLSHVIETEITADDHLLLSSPLPHSAGVLALAGLLQGAVVEVMKQFDMESTLNKIETGGVTYLFMVPTMINRLLDATEERPNFDPGRLQTILYGASPISEERLRQGLRIFGPVFMQLYGQTEAPNFLTRLRKDDHDADRFPKRLRSCGQRSLMAAVRVVRNDDTDCDPHEVGEVIGSAPYVMDRYLNRPKATEETVRNGWLYTGDLGYMDEDGYVYLVDRKKDMIITGGFNVYASEVEQALSALDLVQDVAVVGTPHPDWGEAVTAYVVPAREGVEPGDIINASRDVLSSYKRPKYVHLTDALPVTAVGKINKKQLREHS
ncbi:AMP-binding protein [Brevibacterium luteolum]|uniref:AMP-binding protein n=1 Tax=Brevibacterium luteolum TaxID=199591 RepID=UPI003B6842B1